MKNQGTTVHNEDSRKSETRGRNKSLGKQKVERVGKRLHCGVFGLTLIVFVCTLSLRGFF